MPKIYKYASAETGLLILKNRNVVVNNPNNFNDLFDTDLLVKDKDVKKGLQLYADYLLENELLENAKKVIRSGNEKDKKICQSFVCNIEKRRKHGIKTKRYYPTTTVKSLELLTKIFGFLLPKEKRESAKQSFLQIDHTIKDNGIIEIKDFRSIYKSVGAKWA